MKISPLKQGRFAVTQQKEFTLIKKGKKTEDESLRMAIQPFLIQTKKDIILCDLGLAIMKEQQPLIFELLQKEGIVPDQVTKILMSHLHKDHLDGIGHFFKEKFIAHFPKATIYIQKREFDFALTQKETYSYNCSVLETLPSLPNIVWMEDNIGQITEKIFYEVTGGHTPFHQVFWIKDEETVFYGADNLPQKAYLDYAIAYKTDYDGKHAMELRKKWQTEAENESWILLLYHDMKNPLIHCQ